MVGMAKYRWVSLLRQVRVRTYLMDSIPTRQMMKKTTNPPQMIMMKLRKSSLSWPAFARAAAATLAAAACSGVCDAVAGACAEARAARARKIMDLDMFIYVGSYRFVSRFVIVKSKEGDARKYELVEGDWREDLGVNE